MLNLKVVAVTGGVSSGKTSVCHIFKQLGAKVISADKIVHKLLTPQNSIGLQVIALLGQEIVKGEHIDRSKIASKVFGNPQLLTQLEQILHPAVREKIAREIQNEKSHGKVKLLVVEIPLLFEGGFNTNYDAVITVTADDEKCESRFVKASKYTSEEYKKRMARQMDPKEKAERADYVIENNGTLEDLFQATTKVYNKLITL